MSESKALGFVFLFLFLALLCLPIQWYGCIFPFVVVALVFGTVAYRKHRRDTKLIEEAERAQLSASRQLPPPLPMSSKGSNRLFVPPPLERRH